MPHNSRCGNFAPKVKTFLGVKIKTFQDIAFVEFEYSRREKNFTTRDSWGSFLILGVFSRASQARPQLSIG